MQNEKCVMVVDEKLPLGIIANTAAILGITLGKQLPEVVGKMCMTAWGMDIWELFDFRYQS